MTRYADLPAPWRAAVDQAWESFAADSLGIGAVVTTADGELVVAGRNRVADSDGPAGRLFGTRLAHAELDVLAALGSDRRTELALWTTLEPCLQCAGAILLFDLTVVRFAATDPLWHGTADVARLNPFVADRWAPRDGPATGALARFGALLPLLWFLRSRGRDHSVGQAFAAREPDLLRRASALLDAGTPGGLVADGAGPAAAYDALTGN
jgi:tRNA(Arg) A34 adenosine deaminase TadA